LKSQKKKKGFDSDDEDRENININNNDDEEEISRRRNHDENDENDENREQMLNVDKTMKPIPQSVPRGTVIDPLSQFETTPKFKNQEKKK